MKILFLIILSTNLSYGAIKIRPFKTDLCTVLPNSLFYMDWSRCCYEHDLELWIGGSKERRLKVDKQFRSCLKKKSNKLIAFLGYSAVRLGMKLPFKFNDMTWGNSRFSEPHYQSLTSLEK